MLQIPKIENVDELCFSEILKGCIHVGTGRVQVLIHTALCLQMNFSETNHHDTYLLLMYCSPGLQVSMGGRGLWIRGGFSSSGRSANTVPTLCHKPGVSTVNLYHLYCVSAHLLLGLSEALVVCCWSFSHVVRSWLSWRQRAKSSCSSLF